MSRLACLALLAAACAGTAPAWVESVEFPWNAVPRHLWESQLSRLKGIGVTRVSLPKAGGAADGGSDAIAELIRIVRRLELEADLEGPVPDWLQPQTRAHGGPLTEPTAGLVRISALGQAAVAEARDKLVAGGPGLLWVDGFDTLNPEGFRGGALGFAGEERGGATALRRSAQLSAFWSRSFGSLKEAPGAAGLRLPPQGSAQAGSGQIIAVRQFVSDNGLSVVAVTNKSGRDFSGDLRAFYPELKRPIVMPAVAVPAHDSLWLPVNIPLTAGPFCRDCTAFATVDHLVYATAELTSMEFENGILAMEFAAHAPGEVILQLSREPSGPLVAGGKPGVMDWDAHTGRARLPFPAGSGPGKRVRIGLAIEPPDATAFFDSARVLVIGEANHLRAQFSSAAIAQRSRLRVPAEFTVTQGAPKENLSIDYEIRVPESAVPGDFAEIAIEADGARMSHARPQLMRAADLVFPDALDVRLAANSRLRLAPAVIPVNQRTGREVIITVRNNAPEIRTFEAEIRAEGLEFSPAKLQVVIGASASREISFRVFARDASAGMHAGEVRLTGAARINEPISFAVFPQAGTVAFEANGFSLLESAKYRAAFLPGWWLEFIGKENNQNLLAAGAVAFTAGPIEAKGDALIFGAGQGNAQRVVRLEDLEVAINKAKK